MKSLTSTSRFSNFPVVFDLERTMAVFSKRYKNAQGIFYI